MPPSPLGVCAVTAPSARDEGGKTRALDTKPFELTLPPLPRSPLPAGAAAAWEGGEAREAGGLGDIEAKLSREDLKRDLATSLSDFLGKGDGGSRHAGEGGWSGWAAPTKSELAAERELEWERDRLGEIEFRAFVFRV